MKFVIIFLIALIVSSIGFKKFVWFISLGYGFSIAMIGLQLLIMFDSNMSVATFIMSILFVAYGIRLGGYLAVREISSASYQKTMKNDIKDGSKMNFLLKILIWISCAFLYACEVSPVFFRLENELGSDAFAYVGAGIMFVGIALETYSDCVKNRFKKLNPDRFCDVSVFRIVRCPNYLGEVLTWTGVFISGITACQTPLQWAAAVFGWVAIVYIMFGGARRLELRQNRHYGNDPEYQRYVKHIPILIPFVPLYSVEKYKWLVG